MEEFKIVQGLTNLGSFGLLCFIAYCFIRYIPSHFTQLAKERADYQQAIILLGAENRKSQEHLTAVFTEEIEKERALCDKRYLELKEDDQKRYTKLEKEYENLQQRQINFELSIREIKHEVNNIANNRAMEQQIKETQGRNKRTEQGNHPK